MEYVVQDWGVARARISMVDEREGEEERERDRAFCFYQWALEEKQQPVNCWSSKHSPVTLTYNVQHSV